MNGGYIELVHRDKINQRSHNWGAPPCINWRVPYRHGFSMVIPNKFYCSPQVESPIASIWAMFKTHSWLMIAGGVILPFIYWGWQWSKNGESRTKPTRIQWYILNTASIFGSWHHPIHSVPDSLEAVVNGVVPRIAVLSVVLRVSRSVLGDCQAIYVDHGRSCINQSSNVKNRKQKNSFLDCQELNAVWWFPKWGYPQSSSIYSWGAPISGNLHIHSTWCYHPNKAQKFGPSAAILVASNMLQKPTSI